MQSEEIVGDDVDLLHGELMLPAAAACGVLGREAFGVVGPGVIVGLVCF